MTPSKITLIIPCFNEEKRIPLDQFESFLSTHSSKNSIISPQTQILFVDDGSQDGTHSLLEKFCQIHSSCQLLKLERNQGKAEAIRQGVLHLSSSTDSQWIGYWDADLATSLSEVDRFFWFLESSLSETDFMVGSRVKMMGTKIERRIKRHYLGRVFATFASIILKIPIYDTQCGAKLIRTPLAKKIFQSPFISCWIFDVELLMRALKENAKIQEIPLSQWKDIEGSKLKLRHWLIAPLELIKIWIHYS